MKKIALFISVVALIATACSKESQEMIADSNEGVSTSYIFTLEADMGEATKTAYADDKTFSWSTGDQISVLFHKDDVNKFYTLSTNAGGSKTATFSGPVDEGWTEGGTDDAKVALFPASAGHVYTAGEPNPISFNIPAKTDFSSTHFSANIPMLGKDNGAGAYQFQHITGSYKFTFTGIPAAVTKVMLTAENIGNGYYLSGNSLIKGSGSDTYLHCYEGSGSKIASYIANVTEGTVSFYIPYRAWDGLKAKLTLQNMTPGAKCGYTICELTGKSTLSSASLSHMIVLPSKNISAYGEGSFKSKFGINWSTVTATGTGVTTSGYEGLLEIKSVADANYLYLLLSIDSSKLMGGQEYSNHLHLFLGNEESTKTDWKWGTAPNTYSESIELGWLKNNDLIKFSSWDALYNDSQATDAGNTAFYEIKLNRTAKTYLSSAGTAHIGVLIFNHYYAWAGDQSTYMYGPASGSLLEVALP